MFNSKKGVIEVQFNWIFIIIIGVVILGFFVNLSMRQKDVSEQKLSATVAEHMKTILTGAQVTERSVNLISVPRRDITYDCGEGFSISIMASFNPRIIFAPSLLKSQSQKLMTWSLDWNMPFRITNFLYLTSPDIYYILVHDFSGVDDDCPVYASEVDKKCVQYDGTLSNPNQIRREIGNSNPFDLNKGPCWCGGTYYTGDSPETKGYCCAGGEFKKIDDWRCYDLNIPANSLSGDDCCRFMGVSPPKVGFCSCGGIEINSRGILKEDARTPPCLHNNVVDRECICGGSLKRGAPDNYVGFCCEDGAFIGTVNLAMRLNNEFPNHPALHRGFVTDVSDLGAEVTRAGQFSPYKFKLIFFNYVSDGNTFTNLDLQALAPDLASMPDEDVTAIDITTSDSHLDDWGMIQFYQKNYPDKFDNKLYPVGEPIPFLKKESLIGAVFADTRDIYDCNMKKAFDRLNMMGKLYHDRTEDISASSNSNCQGYYLEPISDFNWMDTTLKHDNEVNIRSAYNRMYGRGITAIKNVNDNLQLESCPLIY